MGNTSIYKCKNCDQMYCAECSENDNWIDFCSTECEKEYEKEEENE